MSDFLLLLREIRYLSTRRSQLFAMVVFAGCWGITALAGLRLTPWAVLLPLLLISVATDIAWKFIPNWLTALSAILALGFAYAEGDHAALINSFKGFCIMFAVSLVLRVKYGLGGGDVKLCACLGACLGPAAACSMLLWSYALGGVFPLCRVAFDHLRPILLYVCCSLGFEAPGVCLCRLNFHDYLRSQQPMAGWFAAGTLLTVSGATLI